MVVLLLLEHHITEITLELVTHLVEVAVAVLAVLVLTALLLYLVKVEQE
jgi:hypothetical protein